MKLILDKDEKMDNVLNNIASIVDGKWYYIPGWFEKTENGELQFHHMEKLPEELTNKVAEIRESQKKPEKEILSVPLTKKESKNGN